MRSLPSAALSPCPAEYESCVAASLFHTESLVRSRWACSHLLPVHTFFSSQVRVVTQMRQAETCQDAAHACANISSVALDAAVAVREEAAGATANPSPFGHDPLFTPLSVHRRMTGRRASST